MLEAAAEPLDDVGCISRAQVERPREASSCGERGL
jgi:hypothetical protein